MSTLTVSDLRLTGVQERYLDFMREFFEQNDQMPPIVLMAQHFEVAPNGVYECLLRLERRGYLARNSVNKFKRGKHFYATA